MFDRVLHVRELVARDRPVKVAVAEAMAKFNCGKRKVGTAAGDAQQERRRRSPV